MGSHSVTCHPAEVTFPPFPQSSRPTVQHCAQKPSGSVLQSVLTRSSSPVSLENAAHSRGVACSNIPLPSSLIIWYAAVAVSFLSSSIFDIVYNYFWNTFLDIQKYFLDIQNNYFGYLEKRINVNSACHIWLAKVTFIHCHSVSYLFTYLGLLPKFCVCYKCSHVMHILYS